MIINNEMIPPEEIGESFIYLGKSFSFDMSTEHVKNELITDFNNYTSILNFHCIQKINCKSFQNLSTAK